MEATISKKTFWIIVFAILFGVIILIYVLSKTTKEVEKPIVPPVIEEPMSDLINYEGLYGVYHNEEDDLSYLQITKNSFMYYANGCEGYFKYDNNNYNIDIDYRKEENEYKATIIIKSKVDTTTFEFNSSLSSATGEIISFIGPYSCSSSRNYIRK